MPNKFGIYFGGPHNLLLTDQETNLAEHHREKNNYIKKKGPFKKNIFALSPTKIYFLMAAVHFGNTLDRRRVDL